mmetsp:Transcript_9122/g.19251  ORF Transcript_9122/g.19251 Transcript_9122/m.19251 type:complete len:180 (+) Transcript_9122:3335-3874(+)
MPTESKKIILSKDGTLRPPPQFSRKERTDAARESGAETPHTSSNTATAASKPKSSSRTDDNAKFASSNTATKPNKKRSGNALPRSATTESPRLPDSSLPSQPKVGQHYYNDVTTKQQGIEMITQKETLYHLDMAWRAQQRLVRRCLGLRLFGETQSSTGTNNNACVGSGAGKKSHASKL